MSELIAKNNSPVTHEFYEIVGEGANIAKAYEDAVLETKRTNLEIAASVGATGYIPLKDGDIRALKFEETPDSKLWGKVHIRNSSENGYLPKKNSKEGKALVAKLDEVKRYPSRIDYLKSIGWDREYEVIDAHGIYFAVTVTVHYPDVRHFIKVPRQADDGWTPSDRLKLVSEEEVQSALNTHNEQAKRLRDQKKAA